MGIGQPGVGSLSLVLHAHLPFVRHPEHPEFLEEDWLFEAITETYVPLALMMDRLAHDGVQFRLTMSMTPTLCEMLADPLLQERYTAHLETLRELADKQRHACHNTPFASAAYWAAERLREVHEYYVDRRARNLLGAFKAHQDAGHLAIITCAATHGFLPLMATDEGRRAQVVVGAQTYRRHFGRPPRGIWLPECAFAPGLDGVLADEGIDYFFVESHGITGAKPRPRRGTAGPVRTPAGAYAFGRDPDSSKQVWSADEGYPGDALYREFYRDLGWDLPYEEVRPYLKSDGLRRHIGLKFHRITGRVDLGAKEPYVPEWARERAAAHAQHFLDERRRQMYGLRAHLGCRPHVVAPFDAELFGHWWYEGPAFLEYFFRKAHFDQSELGLATCEEIIDSGDYEGTSEPAMSSWGDGGYYDVWLNGENDWIYPHLHRAEERMVQLATHFETPPSDLHRRAMNQAARELLLAQASDWAFIMTMRTSVPYAHKRTREHLSRFDELYRRVVNNEIDAGRLGWLEWLDNPFRDLDYRVYHPSGVRRPGAGSAVLSLTY